MNDDPRSQNDPWRTPPSLAAHTAQTDIPCPSWCQSRPHPYRHALAHPGYYRTHVGPSTTVLHTLHLQLVQFETAASAAGPVHLEGPALSIDIADGPGPEDPPPLSSTDLRAAAAQLIALADDLDRALSHPMTTPGPTCASQDDTHHTRTEDDERKPR